MDIRASNVQSVLHVPSSQLAELLPRLFSKLVEPDQDETLLLTYTGAIKKRFESDKRQPGGLGFDAFESSCVEAGIIKTMLRVTQNMDEEQSGGNACAIAGYHALDSLHYLIKIGNIQERKRCLDQMLEEGVVDLCADKIANDALCINRNVAASMLRFLAAEAYLPEKLIPAQISQLLTKLCEFTLAGPDFFVEQMHARDTKWQSRMFMGSPDIPSSKSARYVPRYYAMAQENAMWAAYGLLCKSPPHSRRFILDILRHDPKVLDLLFKCATIVRPPWYPETQVDSIACEVISLFFAFPLTVIPGVVASLDGKIKEEVDAELDAMVETTKILTSRDNWVAKILSVWKKIEDEKWQQIEPLFQRVKRDYLAQEPPDDESFLRLFEYRGITRICMLRLITNMTHTAADTLTDAAITSILRIGYLGCQKVKRLETLNPQDVVEHYTYIERVEEIFRTPVHVLLTEERVEAIGQIANEAIVGPLAYIRLLTILAQHGTLSDIQTWTRVPDGSGPYTSLNQIKQMTSPDVIRIVVPLTVKRVIARRETGNERIQEGDAEFAQFAYSSAAELAIAVITFDETTNGRWKEQVRGVRKEAVLCLGSAAEMALRLCQYRRAVVWALEAIRVGEKAGGGEVDSSFLAKNKRLADRARARLS